MAEPRDTVAPPPIGRLVSVTHRYGKVVALDDVSLDIPLGRMVGVIGPDGVGKSTLFGLVAGARKGQGGTVEVFGGAMANSRHREAVCARIAYMPQGLGRNLYQEISVRENLDFFGRLFGQGTAERARRIRRLVGATGLTPFLDRPAGQLSGGMKQKLGLCCALIHDPDLLILDEPTTGVDPLSRRQFWNLIDALRAERPQMSVLISTAYMDEAQHCDRLAVMDAGRILATGTPAELKARTGESDLEAVFIALLPESRRGPHGRPTIPPRIATGGPPVIVATHLTRRFGDFTAVDDVGFTIETGEIFGFLGSNGSGKTTTMKMLAGLLAPSQGEARIYGKAVDANDMATRRRVGFMSQSFSLYGELTARQNLLLHARLYHLAPEAIESRIADLLARVGLVDHADAVAADLPLGLRQRLSLAVAIIHDPELLILDEPTSGVDPIARDEFWRLLIHLSRDGRVTIFVSTHFMNEAMRCDRISLMHAGRVLVCDEPAKIIAAAGAADLEAAFIAHIERAEGADTTTVAAPTEAHAALAPAAPAEALAATAPARDGGAPAASLRRLLAYSRCETLSILRDPIRLAFALVGTLILLLIFGFGISTDVQNLTYAAFDHDQTPQSRSYLANFSGSRYFVERPPITGHQDLEARLRSNEITLALEIPPDFGRNLERGSPWQISAWIDGANTMRAGTIEGYVQGAHATFVASRAGASSTASTSTSTAVIQVRYLYNPSFESIYAMGPSIPAMLLMMFPAILMAVSVAREKEIGTITNFYVTPTRRLEFLVGKQIPYVAIGMINYVTMVVVIVHLFGVPLKGSVTALTLGALLYVAAATGYGLVISMFTSSQVAAVFAGAILSMLPTMQFSGMMQPVSTLEGGARIMGWLWPTTYYMHMSVGAFTKGLAAADLMVDMAALAVFVPAFLVMAVLALKKQEA